MLIYGLLQELLQGIMSDVITLYSVKKKQYIIMALIIECGGQDPISTEQFPSVFATRLLSDLKCTSCCLLLFNNLLGLHIYFDG